MLSRGDDYLVHQTAEPVAHLATGDRNFYDRYFFNGYSRDGEFFFAVALGVYPNRSVMDAAIAVIHRGRHVALRASRRMPADRGETVVGPIALDVLEPLRRLRLRIAPNEHGIAGDLEFVARGPAIEEPRFQRRAGARLVMDYTRLTQHGGWAGRLVVDGEEVRLDPERHWGSRDRSWGVRPLGEPEGGAPIGMTQFFWLWAPLNFPTTVTHFDVNEEADGRRWHEMGVVAPAAESGPAGLIAADGVGHELRWKRGTRHVEEGAIAMRFGKDEARIVLRPLYRFSMSSIGYLHPTWGHGTWHGDLEVAGESFATAEVDETSPLHLHAQSVCEARLHRPGARVETGIGVLEQLVLGPHAPCGFTGLLDGAP